MRHAPDDPASLRFHGREPVEFECEDVITSDETPGHGGNIFSYCGKPNAPSTSLPL